MLRPSLAPDDVVKSRTAAKEWNKGNKCGPCGERFFFLMQKEPCEISGDFVSMQFEAHDFF